MTNDDERIPYRRPLRTGDSFGNMTNMTTDSKDVFAGEMMWRMVKRRGTVELPKERSSKWSSRCCRRRRDHRDLCDHLFAIPISRAVELLYSFPAFCIVVSSLLSGFPGVARRFDLRAYRWQWRGCARAWHRVNVCRSLLLCGGDLELVDTRGGERRTSCSCGATVF